MQAVEILSPESGVARLRIGGVKYFRAIDLAEQTFGKGGKAGAA